MSPATLEPATAILDRFISRAEVIQITGRSLIEKTRIGSKQRKKYENPTTPYQRLVECGRMDEEAKRKLSTVHETLNPFALKKEIERKLRRVFNALKAPEQERRLKAETISPSVTFYHG